MTNETCRIHVDMTRDLKRRLKLLAAARDTDMMALVRQLIERELEGYQGLELAADAARAIGRKRV